MSESIEIRIANIIATQLGVEKALVTPKAKLIEDLGADSLDLVELIMALEEEYGIDIPDEESEHIRTVEDAIEFVKRVQAL